MGGEYVKCIPDISFEILLLHKILIPVSVKISDYLGVLYIDAAKYAVYAVLVVMAGFIFNRYITPQVKKMFGCAASLLHLSV